MQCRRSIIKRALAALAAIGALAAPSSWAQNFPDRPIRLVVPFPAGQGSDLATRVLAEQMSKLLPHPIVIENRAGADGAVSASVAVKAKPDGYTLLLGTNALHAANSAFGHLPYDPVKDFEPIGLFYGGGMMLLAGSTTSTLCAAYLAIPLNDWRGCALTA